MVLEKRSGVQPLYTTTTTSSDATTESVAAYTTMGNNNEIPWMSITLKY